MYTLTANKGETNFSTMASMSLARGNWKGRQHFLSIASNYCLFRGHGNFYFERITLLFERISFRIVSHFIQNAFQNISFLFEPFRLVFSKRYFDFSKSNFATDGASKREVPPTFQWPRTYPISQKRLFRSNTKLMHDVLCDMT